MESAIDTLSTCLNYKLYRRTGSVRSLGVSSRCKLGSGGTNNVEEASAEAVERLISAAENIGADAVIRVQFAPVTSESSDDYISMFCYGTAVKLAS